MRCFLTSRCDRERAAPPPRDSKVKSRLPCRLTIALACLAVRTDAAEFNFDALRSIIQTRHVSSVEELIPLLPSTLRSRYAVVFASRSLQEASERAPRIILYGPDARLVLTFNGDPGQRGFDSVETLEFGQDKQFRLREIRFTSPGSDATVRVSEPNPKLCQVCHGLPARPLWDRWPLWPGAFGERYDAPLSVREHAGLQSFLAQQDSHPRYKHLLAVERLKDPETFHTTRGQRYAGNTREPPNAELAALLGGMTAQALAHQMHEQPAFAHYQYALLGLASGDCGPVGDFLPSAARSSARAALQRLAKATTAINHQTEEAKQQRLSALDSPNREPSSGAHGLAVAAPAATLVPLRLIAEAALGMRTDTWTLALEQRTYDFTPAPGEAPTLRDALLAEVAGQDPTLAALSLYATSVDGDRYCRYLQHRSQASLSEAATPAVDWTNIQELTAAAQQASTPTNAPDQIETISTAPPHPSQNSSAPLSAYQLLRICASCHESAAAPHIPFLEEPALRQALLTRTRPHGRLLDEVLFRLSPAAADRRMPLGPQLSDEQRGELARYFVSLTTQTP